MYDNIMKVSHKLEDIFYYLRENVGIKEPHMELTDIVFQVMDFINGEMEKIKEGNDPDGDNSQLIEMMEKFLVKLKGAIDEAGSTAPEQPKPKAETSSSAGMDLGPNQFYIAPQASGTAKCFRIKITYHEDTQMSNLRAYSATYALKEYTEDVHYTPEDILTDETSSETILADGFQMLVRGDFTEEKLHELLDTTSEIRDLLISECTNAEFERGFSGEPVQEESSAAPEESPEAQKKEAEPQPGDYVIQKEAGKAKQITKKKKKETKQAFMSVSIDKMNMLMDLMGEMVIAESVVLQNPDLQVPNLDLSNFQKAASQLSKITTEMQELIMSMRMMPLTNTFQKMNRTVFDMSRKLGKNIEFEMIGDNTEVDKNIIENISDPLMHLVRNSVDHGVEMPEERAAGCLFCQQIIVRAAYSGGRKWCSYRHCRGETPYTFLKAREKCSWLG